jgi:DHA1 family multidrug resistance protein-like MFS transporter
LDTSQIGYIFVGLGIISILMQAIGLRALLKSVHSKKFIVTISLALASISMAMLGLRFPYIPFTITLLTFSLVNSPVLPIITGLLSERTKGEDQGGILGINQSYTSLGQVLGPLAAGAVAARLNVESVFFLSAFFLITALVAARFLYLPKIEKADL